VEIQRSGGNEKDLGPLFMLASVLIITLQLPLARFARRVGAVRILPVGFLLLSPPLRAWRCLPDDAAGRLAALAAFGLFVTLLTLGKCCWYPRLKI
jgi:hypothetical protein